MTEIDPTHRAQIEAWLGRSLTDSELQPVTSLEALAKEQLAVIVALRPRHVIAPLLYLRAIVPASVTRDVLDNIEVEIASSCSHELTDFSLFEPYAGRALSAAETSPCAALEELSPAHRAIAARLARRDLVVAFLYLHSIVRTAAAEACHMLARRLAFESDGA